jgi:hypothetical protein
MATDAELILRLRARTDKLERDLKGAQRKIKRFGTSTEKIGASIQASMLAAFGGGAVLQGLRMAVSSLANFEFAMDKVEAISGATGDTLEALKKNALDLGRTTKFTATEIATLQLELSKLGFSSDKILASTDAIRKLATVADEDLGESAKTLAGTLNSFNLEATESERVANTMAESFSKSALTLEKFTVATANSGAIANALGVTLESNTARIGALVDANIDASKAGTDLRKIYIDLNKAGISYDDALDMVANSSDKVGKATELVGIRAAGALVILSEQREKVDELTKSLSDNNQELDTMVDIMEDNLLTDWAKFTSAIDGAIQKGTGLTALGRKILQLGTFITTALSGGLPTPEEEFIQKWTDAGKKISNSVSQSKGGLDALSKSVKFYENSLKEATSKVKAFEEENTNEEGRLVLRGKILEYRELKDVVLKYASILTPLTEKQESLAKSLEKTKTAVKSVREEISSLSGMKSISGDAARLFFGGGLESVGATDGVSGEGMMAGIGEAIDQSAMEIQEKYAFLISTIDMMNAQLNASFRNTATELISGLANAIGSGAGIDDAFKVVLGIFAGGLQQIGKALIAYGVTLAAADKALKNPFTSWQGAIAAGFVAVAAGAALKGAISSSSSGMASGGGGGSSRGGFQFDRSGQSVDVSVVGRIEGQDIVLVLDEANRQNERNVG